MTSDLQARLRNTETSILFMQREHAKTLEGLHSEIQKLQEKCADLTFRLAMEETSRAPSTLDAAPQCTGVCRQQHPAADVNNVASIRVAELEALLQTREEAVERLEETVRDREAKLQRVVLALERERECQARESASWEERERTLKSELEARAGRVAFLTAQLHKVKVGRDGEAALVTVQPHPAQLSAMQQQQKHQAMLRQQQSGSLLQRAPRRLGGGASLPDASIRHSDEGLRMPRPPSASSSTSNTAARRVDATSAGRRVVAAGGRRFRQATAEDAEDDPDDQRRQSSARPKPPVLPPINGPGRRSGGGGGGQSRHRLNTNNNNSADDPEMDDAASQHRRVPRSESLLYEDVNIIDLSGGGNDAFKPPSNEDLAKYYASRSGSGNSGECEDDPSDDSSYGGGGGAMLEGPVLVRKARVRTVNRRDLARHQQHQDRDGARQGEVTMGVLAVDASEVNWRRGRELQNNPTTP